MITVSLPIHSSIKQKHDITSGGGSQDKVELEISHNQSSKSHSFLFFTLVCKVSTMISIRGAIMTTLIKDIVFRKPNLICFCFVSHQMSIIHLRFKKPKECFSFQDKCPTTYFGMSFKKLCQLSSEWYCHSTLLC